VATNSREQKKTILKFLNETGNPDLIDFMLHDFGARGVTCREQSAIGAGAHLTQFLGTDTLQGLLFLRDYYNDRKCIGKSVPASEHSTMTSWTKENELEAYKNMLTIYPEGIVSIVIDSYDPVRAIKFFGTDLKDLVVNRKGKTVLRPDSGYPPDVDLMLLEELSKYFPVRKNEKGYKILPEYIGLIQGDGIDHDMIVKILSKLKNNGWSANNIVFGSGGGLLQKMNRDTQKCACKCSLAIIDGKEVYVFKDPIMDKVKKSKKGYTTLHQDEDNNFITKCNGKHDFESDLLETVFENGKLVKEYSIEEIRKFSKIKI
jgi:nicotinamide phosphoribosyltransferase